MAVNKIDKFEKNNPDIAINVLFNDRGIYICRKSKHNDRKHIANLLMICDGENRHYTAVKSMSRLLGASNSKNGRRQHFCINCLQGFHSEKTRNDHFDYCRIHRCC